MNSEMGKKKSSSSLIKKLEQYLSMKKVSRAILSKSRSWHNSTINHKSHVAPEGCFWVYVGPEKERFVIKTKYASHPLFMMLLEDAEKEYGFKSPGPIMLPCEVDLFYKVLAEMESSREIYRQGYCGGSCSPNLFSPARRVGNYGQMGKGYGSYSILPPPRLNSLNSFNCV